MHGTPGPLKAATRCFCGLVLGLALLLTCGPSWGAWEITRFVAYEGPAIDAPDRREAWEASLDPASGVSLADQALAVVSPGWRELEEDNENRVLDEAMLRDIESFLEQVAIEYSRLGFADPVAAGRLDSVVLDASGQKAIRFYIYDRPGAPQGWYSEGTDCSPGGTSRKTININTLRFAPGDENGNRIIRGVDWATLAHELMHPVMDASRFMQDKCRVGGWISEGIPDAISFDVTRKVLNVDFAEAMEPKKGSSIMKIYGIRSYAQPLQGHVLASDPDINTTNVRIDESYIKTANININYPTSSFWRYLAEAWYTKMRNPNTAFPGSRATAGPGYSYVDYGYLVEMFNSVHPYSQDPMQPDLTGDIRWVNEFLKSEPHIKSSLARMYGRFVSSFAAYDVDRIGPARAAAAPPDASWDPPPRTTWLKILFNGCDTATHPIGSSEGANVEVRVLSNAATCIHAEPPEGPYPYGTAVDIVTLENELSLLKSLRIGLPDGSIVLAPEIYSFMGGGAPYFARWSFPLSAAQGGDYILINMASSPQDTRNFTGDFRFSLGTWESDMTTVPPPPAEPPATQPGDGWRPTRRENAKRLTEASLADPMNHLVPKSRVERPDDGKQLSCDPQRRQLNLCGPQLHISLDLFPAAGAIPLSGTGSMGLYSAFPGTDGINPWTAMQSYGGAMLEAERELDARDGDSIDIYIPLIEYGFSGSFTNAVIKVDKGRSGRRDNETDYTAYGPPVPRTNGMGKIWQPPTGRVTIDEYSQTLLSGTFSADLVDDEASSSDHIVIARTISGRFRISAPFTGDGNFELDKAHLKREMIGDMLEAMPAGQAAMRAVLQASDTPPAVFCEALDEFQLRAISMEAACRENSGSGASPKPVTLNCSCDCGDRQREKPVPECQSQCEATWRQCAAGEVEVSGDMAEEIAHYRSLMDAKGINAGMQDILVEQYRKMPEWQRKLTIQGYQ